MFIVVNPSTTDAVSIEETFDNKSWLNVYLYSELLEFHFNVLFTEDKLVALGWLEKPFPPPYTLPVIIAPLPIVIVASPFLYAHPLHQIHHYTLRHHHIYYQL